MLENYIIIKDLERKDLELALTNLANLYVETDYAHGIQLYGSNDDENSYLVLFANQPDLERFIYFVNYIRYPEVLDDLRPYVRAYYRTLDMDNKLEFAVGSYVLIYVSEFDTDYASVNIVNENKETFLCNFGSGVKKLEQNEIDFELVIPNIDLYNHISTFYPEPKNLSKESEESKPWWRFW
jgi:hypothetical protein